MFIYNCPAKRYPPSAEVMEKVRSGIAPEVAFGTPEEVKSTAALTPGPARPWIWEAATGAVNPAPFKLTVIWVSAAFEGLPLTFAEAEAEFLA